MSQLKRLDELIESKRELFLLYKNSINAPEDRFLEFNHYETLWFIDFLLTPDESQSAYQELLIENDIQVRKGYPPLSKQSMFSETERTDLSYSEEKAERI